MPIIAAADVRPIDVAGVRRRVVGDLRGPNPYVTGGELILPGEIGLGVIEMIHFGGAWAPRDPPNDGAGTPILSMPAWNPVTGYIQWFAGGLFWQESTNGSNLSLFISRFEAIGR